jgi:hypothetical protein
MKPACVCACGNPVVHSHHVTYRQTIVAARPADLKAAIADERNLVPVAFRCHANHHARSRPYALSMLPDSVFEFAAELLGPGKAYNRLRRVYVGEDARLDALLSC